jgi:hypothetical protein
MSSGSDQAKDKLAEYLRLAAQGGGKTEEEIDQDAETIVQGIAEGTMQQFEHREQPNRRRGT